MTLARRTLRSKPSSVSSSDESSKRDGRRSRRRRSASVAALDGSSSSEDGSLHVVVTVKSDGSIGVEAWRGGVESSPRSISGMGWLLVLVLLGLVRR